MVRKLLVLFLMLFSIVGVSAIQSLGTFQMDNSINLVQGCSNSTYSNISRITYPNSSFALDTETIMTLATTNNYNYIFSDTNSIGQYLVYGHCDEDSVDTQWVYDFIITSTGDQVSSSNTIIVIVFLIMSLLFLALAHGFSSEYWIIKSFFNFSAVGMGILSVNSARIIASESSNLGKMGNVGLTMMIAVFALFFLYIFVYAFIEIIKSMKEKKGVRWNYE